ncbi:MAG: reeler domain-containing protein [Pseudomonadota bacterium]
MYARSLSAAAAVLLLALPAQRPAAFASGPGTCIAEASAITGMGSRTRNLPGAGPFQVMFDMGGTTYVPGQTHMISVFATDVSEFNGFLVYGETTMGMRVGSFDKSDGNIGSPIVTCPDAPEATASHTSLGPAATTEIIIPWTAPATDVGSIELRSIVLSGARGSRGGQEFFFPAVLTLTAGPPDLVFGDGFEL